MSSEDRPVRFTRRGRRRRSCPPRWPRRCRWCSTSCSRTPSTTPSRPSSTCRPRPAGWWCGWRNDGERLQATVVDDGVGLPEGFALDAATGLGLSIVRTLVTTELDGHDRARAGRRRRRPAGHGRAPRRARSAERGVAGAGREPTSCRAGGRSTGSGVGSGGAALASDVLLAQLAALLLGGAAPHAGVLVGGEGVLEARGLGLALAADGLGVLDLLDGRAGGADREEQVGVGVAARARRRASRRARWSAAGGGIGRGPRGSSAAGARSRRVRDEFHMPPRYGEQTEERVRLRWTR